MRAVVMPPSILAAHGKAPCVRPAVDLIHPDQTCSRWAIIVWATICCRRGAATGVVRATKLPADHCRVLSIERIIAYGAPSTTVEQFKQTNAVIAARVQTHRIHRRKRLHLNQLDVAIPIDIQEITPITREELAADDRARRTYGAASAIVPP